MLSWKSNTGNIWDPLSTRSKISLPSRCSLFDSDRNSWARMLGITRGMCKIYICEPALAIERMTDLFIQLLYDFTGAASLLPWTKGWRPDIISERWGKADARTSVLSISLNMTEILLWFWDRILTRSCLPSNFQRQLFQRALPKPLPFSSVVPFLKLQGTASLLLCVAQQLCSLQLNWLSENYRSVWLQLIRGECIFTPFPGGCVLTSGW